MQKGQLSPICALQCPPLGRFFSLLFIAVLLSSCGAPSVSGPKQSLKQDQWGHRPGPQGFHTVIIDAGHGGKDSGALGVVRGSKEKDLALDTAKRLKRKLGSDFRVVMLRSGDQFVDLNRRVAKANRYESAILVSLHFNSSRSSRPRGPETYYWRVDSHGLATRIQSELEKVSPGRQRSRGLVRRRLRMTRNPRIPCVLVEFGYLTHPSEGKLCTKANYKNQLADAMARALITQQQKGDAGTGRKPRAIYKPLSKESDPPGS